MAGILRERNLRAKNIDSLNYSFIAEFDVDGGNVIKLSVPTGGTVDDVRKAEKPATGGLLGLAMAYNPSVRYTEVNGRKYAGLSVDERDYTNLAGIVGDCFIPQVGDEIGVIAANIDNFAADQAKVIVGNYLEAQNSKHTLKVTETTPTADTFSMKIVRIVNEKFPQAGIGMETVPVYVCEVVQN